MSWMQRITTKNYGGGLRVIWSVSPFPILDPMSACHGFTYIINYDFDAIDFYVDCCQLTGLFKKECALAIFQSQCTKNLNLLHFETAHDLMKTKLSLIVCVMFIFSCIMMYYVLFITFLTSERVLCKQILSSK